MMATPLRKLVSSQLNGGIGSEVCICSVGKLPFLPIKAERQVSDGFLPEPTP